MLLNQRRSPVHFGQAAMEFLSNYLGDRRPGSVFVLVDENSLEQCWPKLMAACSGLEKAELLQIESGESEKNLEICASLWSALTELGADRKSLLINLGGGVITDMGGFVASCFKRGISFINIPTTLLGQVDAAIGGKTGVDLGVLKNQIGLFSEPVATLIYTPLLESLDIRQWNSGFAEVIKYAMALDKSLWEGIAHLKSLENGMHLENIIRRSAEIKMRVVEQDPLEAGERKKLNFGHTIGHAIESFLMEDEERRLLHGEAIALGMIAEIYLSVTMLNLKKSSFSDQESYIKGLFPDCPFSVEEIPAIAALCKHDKKNVGEEIRCTLLTSLGVSETDHAVSVALIEEALLYTHSLYHEG